jgi:CheY-like chemotaxis protein
MEEFAKLITAIGSLFWPLIFFYLLYRFSEPLARVIESTRTRKFAIKVAGNELTVEEASEQQVRLISDLQSKVTQLEAVITQRIALPQPAAPAHPLVAEASEQSTPEVTRVLWVDDSPKNNSYVVALLNQRGIQVDFARSTEEGLRSFRSRQYDAIVTDMGRPEGERAGIDLTRKIREVNHETPIYFYTTSWAARNLRADVKQAGANGITSSSSTLMSSLLSGQRAGS